MNAKPRLISRLGLVLLALAGLALCGVCGCSWGKTKRAVIDAKDEFFHTKPTARPIFAEDATPLTDLNAEAADDLIFSLQGRLSTDSPIYVERFANLRDPNDAGTFGKIIADQVATRMAQRSYRIVMGPPPPKQPEPEAKPEEKTGIFTLKKEYRSQPALLSGTYTIGEDLIYVSARLTRLEDNALLSGLNWTLPVNKNTRELVPQLKRPGEGTTPSVYTTPPPRTAR